MSNGPSENANTGPLKEPVGDTSLTRNSFGAKSQELVSELLPKVLDDLKTLVNAGKALAPYMQYAGSSGEDPALYDFVLAAIQPDLSFTAGSRQKISLSAQNGGICRFEVEQEFVGEQEQSLLLLVHGEEGYSSINLKLNESSGEVALVEASEAHRSGGALEHIADGKDRGWNLAATTLDEVNTAIAHLTGLAGARLFEFRMEEATVALSKFCDLAKRFSNQEPSEAPSLPLEIVECMQRCVAESKQDHLSFSYEAHLLTAAMSVDLIDGKPFLVTLHGKRTSDGHESSCEFSAQATSANKWKLNNITEPGDCLQACNSLAVIVRQIGVNSRQIERLLPQ